MFLGKIIQIITFFKAVQTLDLIHRVGNVQVYQKASFQEFQFQTKLVHKFDFTSIQGFKNFTEKFLPMLKDDKYDYLYNLVIDLSNKLKLITQMNTELNIQPRSESYSPSCVVAYGSFNNYDLKRYIEIFNNKKKEYAGKVINQDTTPKEIEKFELYVSSLIQTADKLHHDIVKMNRINGELISGNLPYEIRPILYASPCWQGPHAPLKVEKADCFIKSATDKVLALACNYLIRVDEQPVEYQKYVSIPFSNISLYVKELYSEPDQSHQLYTIECEQDLMRDRICDVNLFDIKCTEALRSLNILDLEYYCLFVTEYQSLPYFIDESIILFDKNCQITYEVEIINGTANETLDLSSRNFPLLIKGGRNVIIECPKGTYSYKMAEKDLEVSEFSLSVEQQARLTDQINETMVIYSSATGITLLLLSGISIMIVIIVKLKGKVNTEGDKTYQPIVRKRVTKDREKTRSQSK